MPDEAGILLADMFGDVISVVVAVGAREDDYTERERHRGWGGPSEKSTTCKIRSDRLSSIAFNANSANRVQTQEKILIGAIAGITAVFTWLDASVWLTRFVDGTLGDTAAFVVWSEGLRFLRTVLALLLVGVLRHVVVSPADYRLLRIAFVLIVVADLFLILQDQLLVGIGVFALVQIVFVIRHLRGWRTVWKRLPAAIRGDKRRKLFGIGVVGVVLLTVSFALLGPLLAAAGLFVPTLVYGTLIVLALCSGWGVPVMGTLPARNAWMIAAGMVFFTVCDITVGMGAALQGHPVGEGARVFTGLFYGPALVLLALSAKHYAADHQNG